MRKKGPWCGESSAGCAKRSEESRDRCAERRRGKVATGSAERERGRGRRAAPLSAEKGQCQRFTEEESGSKRREGKPRRGARKKPRRRARQSRRGRKTREKDSAVGGRGFLGGVPVLMMCV
eukprot:484938-Rhodomonas_salina.1